MRKLYYATFEKGYGEIVQKYIKKQDKNSHVRRIYPDSVIFFAAENFAFENSLFIQNYHVLDEEKKEGTGAVNAYMKHLLERKNLKIYFKSTVKKIKLTFSKYSEKLLIDQKLRGALETMLAKCTKKQVGYLGADAELLLLFKSDGECLLLQEETKTCEISKLEDGFGISPRAAIALNFLSEPAESEVSLDPYADNGYISYTRALCFKKANVIANCHDETKVPPIKKLAKTLKERAFSILSYDFCSEIFPIRFIDKIVTSLPPDRAEIVKLIEKAYVLKVKKLALFAASINLEVLVKGKFEVEKCYSVGKNKIYILNFIK